MTAKKDKWFGKCEMCGGNSLKLSTTHTTIGPVRYYLRRCCNHCQRVMRHTIDFTMMIAVADRKQFDEEVTKILEGVLE